jgi:hypothetical protein
MKTLVCSRICSCFLASSFVYIVYTISSYFMDSLTDASSLEVADSIRKQIFRIKDTESVCMLACHLHFGTKCQLGTRRPRWMQERSGVQTRDCSEDNCISCLPVGRALL